jgi:hypothetical protein
MREPLVSLHYTVLEVVIIIIIITGTTALCDPWSSSGLFPILPYCRSVRLLLLWISEQCNFYGVRLSASRPTPNLEDKGIPEEWCLLGCYAVWLL